MYCVERRVRFWWLSSDISKASGQVKSSQVIQNPCFSWTHWDQTIQTRYSKSGFELTSDDLMRCSEQHNP
jgi:hypothetical protein